MQQTYPIGNGYRIQLETIYQHNIVDYDLLISFMRRDDISYGDLEKLTGVTKSGLQKQIVKKSLSIKNFELICEKTGWSKAELLGISIVPGKKSKVNITKFSKFVNELEKIQKEMKLELSQI